MRVNIYAEEMTDRVEIVEKTVEGHLFTAVRFYLALPATYFHKGVELRPASALDEHEFTKQYRAPFIHRPGDDDSAAVTFWGKRDMRPLLRKALALLDQHYGDVKP